MWLGHPALTTFLGPPRAGRPPNTLDLTARSPNPVLRHSSPRGSIQILAQNESYVMAPIRSSEFAGADGGAGPESALARAIKSRLFTRPRDLRLGEAPSRESDEIRRAVRPEGESPAPRLPRHAF